MRLVINFNFHANIGLYFYLGNFDLTNIATEHFDKIATFVESN